MRIKSESDEETEKTNESGSNEVVLYTNSRPYKFEDEGASVPPQIVGNPVGFDWPETSAIEPGYQAKDAEDEEQDSKDTSIVDASIRRHRSRNMRRCMNCKRRHPGVCNPEIVKANNARREEMERNKKDSEGKKAQHAEKRVELKQSLQHRRMQSNLAPEFTVCYLCGQLGHFRYQCSLPPCDQCGQYHWYSGPCRGRTIWGHSAPRAAPSQYQAPARTQPQVQPHFQPRHWIASQALTSGQLSLPSFTEMTGLWDDYFAVLESAEIRRRAYDRLQDQQPPQPLAFRPTPPPQTYREALTQGLLQGPRVPVPVGGFGNSTRGGRYLPSQLTSRPAQPQGPASQPQAGPQNPRPAAPK